MIRVLPYSRSHTVKNLGFSTSAWLEGRVENYNNDVVVRWGNTQMLSDRHGRQCEFRHVLNPAKAIVSNMCKANALSILSKAVRTPKLFTRQTPAYGLFVFRPYAHQGGSGFKVVEAKGKPINVNNWEYATEFIRTNTEYRVWFCGNRTLRAQRARTVEQQEEGPVGKFPCRSKWGYAFRDYVPQTLHDYTIRAARAIGLDCGAADVLLANDKWYFLELNSAPSTDLGYLNRWFKNGINALCHERFGV